MKTNIMQCAIPIGASDWFPLKRIGDKYFMTSVKPIFKGYYSLEEGDFAHSRLYKLLSVKYMAMLQNDSVDVSCISGMSILTQGQYNLYVYKKLPLCGEYLLQTNAPGTTDHILAVTADGTLRPVHITSQNNIRPCFFIDAEYLESLVDEDIVTTEEFCAAMREQDEKRKQAEAAEAARIEEEKKRIAAEQAARVTTVVVEKTPEEIQRITPIIPLPIVVETEPQEQPVEQTIIVEPVVVQPADIAIETKIATEDPQTPVEDTTEPAPITEDVTPDVTTFTPEGTTPVEPECTVNEQEETTVTNIVEPNTETTETPVTEEVTDEQPVVHEAPIIVNTKPETAPTSEVVTEYVDGHKVESNNTDVHAVYVYQDEYKDYAILVTEGDVKMQQSIERMGVAIRAYMQSSTNEKRAPMRKINVTEHISRLQNRWRG